MHLEFTPDEYDAVRSSLTYIEYRLTRSLSNALKRGDTERATWLRDRLDRARIAVALFPEL